MRRVVVGLLLACAVGGCRRHPASAEDCVAILDRIVELELHELGFRDPVLARRKSEQARRLLAADLGRCRGVRIRDRALECVRTARSVEEISHRCLR